MNVAPSCQMTEKWEKLNFAENQEGETLLMAAQIDEDVESDLWYVDTGCSNHVWYQVSFLSFK